MMPAGYAGTANHAESYSAARKVGSTAGLRENNADDMDTVLATEKYAPGIALRLASAFLLLAALPVVAAVVGLLGIASVNQSLEELENNTLYFGIRDREFRRGTQILARVYADPANFLTDAALTQAQRDSDSGLALMRKNLEELVTRGLIEQAGALILQQRGLEIAMTATVQVARQGIELRASKDASVENPDAQAIAPAAAEADLRARLAGLRDRHESMINLLADIDQSNVIAATERVDQARQGLQKMALGIVASAALCAAVALAILVFYVLRNLVRRLERVTVTVDRLDAGNLSGPIGAEGIDEIAKINGALENLRTRILATRELKAALKSSQRNLVQSNQDRDRFAHAAAHDLRAPLRGIRNIAEFMVDDLGELAAGKTQRQFQIMRGRIERLDNLLESLLEYTRAGSTRPEPATHSVGDLMRYSTVHIPGELAQIDIRCDEGTIRTWREPLAQVLRQLVDNAIKHNDHQPARIQIDCRLQRRSLQIRVIDDGPGIEPQYHQSIFRMFQTLQSRDHTEGSGMGLAIAQKLVQTYAGRLLVESDPEDRRGSVFLVTWPIASAATEIT